MEEEKISSNPDCESQEHPQHLCFLMNENFHHTHKEEYQAMVSGPQFVCGKCSQTAKSDKNLCEPEKL